LDPASQNALRHPFSGVGAKQRQFFLAKGAQSPAAVCRKRNICEAGQRLSAIWPTKGAKWEDGDPASSA
jgi:hypothetical protein